MAYGTKTFHVEGDPRMLMEPTTYFWNGPKGQACCVAVNDPTGWGFNRCAGKGTNEERVGDRTLYFCAIHKMAAVQKRAAARAEKQAQQRAQSEAHWALERRKREALHEVERLRAALEKIAAGDNDAMGTARAALGMEPEKEKY